MSMTEYETDRFRTAILRNGTIVGTVGFGLAGAAFILAAVAAAGAMMRGNMSIVHVLALLAMAGSCGAVAAVFEAAAEVYGRRYH